MKFTLTVTDATAAEIAKLLAVASVLPAPQPADAPTMPAPQPIPQPQPADAPTMPAPQPIPQPQPAPVMPVNSPDDDESGDTNPTGELDESGIPHDERIHSSPAKQTAKGFWRKKRGVSDELVKQVEDELKAKVAATSQATAAVPMPQPQPAPAMPTPQPMPQATAAAMPQLQPAPAMPAPHPMPEQVQQPQAQAAPAPAMPAPQPMPEQVQQPQAQAAPAPAADGIDFQGFMQHLSTKMQERTPDGKMLITADYLEQRTAEIATAFNTPLAAITDVAANPQMITYAAQLLQRDGRW
jgi:hypothetical protein